MARKMTRRMGEAFAKKIAKAFGVAEGEIGPTVNDRWYGPDQLIIGWEEGPFEWPMSETVWNLPAPKGWFAEPVNHWAIALYPK